MNSPDVPGLRSAGQQHRSFNAAVEQQMITIQEGGQEEDHLVISSSLNRAPNKPKK